MMKYKLTSKELHSKKTIIRSYGIGVDSSGADGLMVELHSNLDNALWDGHQSLKISKLFKLMKQTQFMNKCIYE